MDKAQRLTVIDLVAPKDNKVVVDAMFTIIRTQPWAIDFEDVIEHARHTGELFEDDCDLDY